MANASLGEPLGYRHAVVLYSAQAAKGTPVTPATAVGLAQVMRDKHSSNARRRGPGSANIIAKKGGSIYTDWSIRYSAVQTGAKPLFLKAMRAAGVLSYLTLGFGYSDDQGTPNREADQIQDAKIGQIEFGLDTSGGHGPLTCSLSGIGGLVTVPTNLAPLNLTTTEWSSYEAVLLRAAAAFECRSLQVQINHNLTRDHVIYGVAPGTFKRGFKYLTERGEAITFSISRYQKLGVAVQNDTITDSDISLVLTNVDDAQTLTINLTGCDFDHEHVDEDENGIFWSTNGEAKGWSVA